MNNLHTQDTTRSPYWQANQQYVEPVREEAMNVRDENPELSFVGAWIKVDNNITLFCELDTNNLTHYWLSVNGTIVTHTTSAYYAPRMVAALMQ